ncbi:MAG: hypothetical protein QOD55_2102 [Solirubrobacteraceae bacterium]|jgi:hypothetical protein|nr:hypothetical protein [Solirubrobacteraceae bacterium]
MAPTPLTVLTPVPLWWSLWIRVTWLVAALTRGLLQRRLRELSFIHFAHWSLVARWPRDPAVSRDRGAPRTLVFLTTFDGSGIQYIDAFVRVVPRQIAALYAGARGFPGARRFRPVERYITDHSHRVDHYYAAHPEASTRMIAQALALRERVEAFERRVEGAGDERFAREYARFLTDAQGLL